MLQLWVNLQSEEAPSLRPIYTQTLRARGCGTYLVSREKTEVTTNELRVSLRVVLNGLWARV